MLWYKRKKTLQEVRQCGNSGHIRPHHTTTCPVMFTSVCKKHMNETVHSCNSWRERCVNSFLRRDCNRKVCALSKRTYWPINNSQAESWKLASSRLLLSTWHYCQLTWYPLPDLCRATLFCLFCVESPVGVFCPW